MKNTFRNLIHDHLKLTALFTLMAVCFFQKTELRAQCDPDATPPSLMCGTGIIEVNLSSSGTATVLPPSIYISAFDNCDDVDQLDFRLEESPASAVPPASNSLEYDESDIGQHSVELWAIDQAGNWTHCSVTLQVGQCPEGSVSALACIAFLEVVVPVGESVRLYPGAILEGGPYCLPPGGEFYLELDPVSTPAPYLDLDASHAGLHIVQVQVYENGTPGISCWGEITVNAAALDCQNDVVAPVAVCDETVVAQLEEDGPGLVTVEASQIDDGSYDNCSSPQELDFRLEPGPSPSPSPPAPASLDFTAPGTYSVLMWVGDAAGNWNQCATTVVIAGQGCPGDTEPPTCNAPVDITLTRETFFGLGIEPNDPAALAAEFGAATASDNCGVLSVLESVGLKYILCGSQTVLSEIERSFVAYDTAGNASPAAVQVISLLPEFTIHLPADYHPGDSSVDSLTFDQGDYSLIGVTYSDQIFDIDCDGETDKIIRTWWTLNWCDYDGVGPATPLPSIDLDGDGEAGDAYDIAVLADSVYLLENGNPTVALTIRNELLSYKQIIRYNLKDTIEFTLTGTVFHDTSADCASDDEPSLAGWPVHVEGLVSGRAYSAVTDAEGRFEIILCTSDTLVEVSLDVPFNYGQDCTTTHTASFTPGVSQTVAQDIPVKLDGSCPILYVDLSTPFLRRCFENYYAVTYTNFSAETIENAYVEVTLDDVMAFTSSTIPGMAIGGNKFAFEVGDLAPGENGNFKVFFELSCDAPLGATHCAEAHIYPDTLCPVTALWSGANIEVQGVCENDTVHLTIINTGAGDMAEPLNFIVVEDVIMYLQDVFDLDATEAQHFSMPANGATWRLEAEQEPGHPYPGSIAVAVEGCNGLNTPGLVNIFPLNMPNPFIAIDCRENIGAFDPNDKLAFPRGYGDERLIEKNTPIEYLIRFQNTGTDTAFKVVILDTLSLHLEPVSVVPEAASHPYRFEILDENVLRFTFDNIMLPDSNVNEPASHGFVKFAIRQQPNLPLGTVIENSAAIYFDFNEPVITETVFLTIGEHFIEVVNDVTEPRRDRGNISIWPNPASNVVNFEIPGDALSGCTFALYNGSGRAVRMERFDGNRFRFERGALQPGVYFYSIENKGAQLYSGRIVIR
jgi:hypothetical protein